jgi:hypothetical protein
LPPRRARRVFGENSQTDKQNRSVLLRQELSCRPRPTHPPQLILINDGAQTLSLSPLAPSHDPSLTQELQGNLRDLTREHHLDRYRCRRLRADRDFDEQSTAADVASFPPHAAMSSGAAFPGDLDRQLYRNPLARTKLLHTCYDSIGRVRARAYRVLGRPASADVVNDRDLLLSGVGMPRTGLAGMSRWSTPVRCHYHFPHPRQAWGPPVSGWSVASSASADTSQLSHTSGGRRR